MAKKSNPDLESILSEEAALSRRNFLGICLKTSGLIATVSIIYPLFRYTSPLLEEEGGGKVEIDVKEVPLWKSKLFAYRGRPSILVHTPEGFVAFNAICTHLGCVVKWRESLKQFVCPCHAGKFNIKGEVLAGPPPSPLELLPVSETPEKVIVG